MILQRTHPINREYQPFPTLFSQLKELSAPCRSTALQHLSIVDGALSCGITHCVAEKSRQMSGRKQVWKGLIDMLLGQKALW